MYKDSITWGCWRKCSEDTGYSFCVMIGLKLFSWPPGNSNTCCIYYRNLSWMNHALFLCACDEVSLSAARQLRAGVAVYQGERHFRWAEDFYFMGSQNLTLTQKYLVKIDIGNLILEIIVWFLRCRSQYCIKVKCPTVPLEKSRSAQDWRWWWIFQQPERFLFGCLATFRKSCVPWIRQLWSAFAMSADPEPSSFQPYWGRERRTNKTKTAWRPRNSAGICFIRN